MVVVVRVDPPPWGTSAKRTFDFSVHVASDSILQVPRGTDPLHVWVIL